MVRYDKIIRTMNIKGFLDKNMLQGQTGLKKAAYNFASEMLEELAQEEMGELVTEGKENLDTPIVNIVGEMLSEPAQNLIDIIRDYEVDIKYGEMLDVIDLNDDKLPEGVIKQIGKIINRSANKTLKEVTKKIDYQTAVKVKEALLKSESFPHYAGHLILAVGSKLKGEFKEQEDEPIVEGEEEQVEHKEGEDFKPDWQDKLSSTNFDENYSISWWGIIKGDE